MGLADVSCLQWHKESAAAAAAKGGILKRRSINWQHSWTGSFRKLIKQAMYLFE